MNFEKSRDGFYTLTFVNKYNLTFNFIKNEFNTVGSAKIKNFLNNRYFIKYLKKEEAERAIEKYGKIYNVSLANHSDRHKEETIQEPQNKLTTSYNLILGNLPKNFTTEDVKFLIEEIHYYNITEIEETKCLKLKFCQITLSSDDHLKYLIKKLDKFILCGEKLIAIDEKDLIYFSEIFNRKLDEVLSPKN